MKPYHTEDRVTLYHAENMDVLPTLPDASVDSVVTDPPYGLQFMGKAWDYDVPDVATWAECLRVLKPGGHLLAFAGTRTQHRMAVNIEDAGFEIRDMLAWVYGSGFPKSLDVSKAIDSVRDWSKLETLAEEIARARQKAGLSLKAVGETMQQATNGQYGKWYHRGGHMFFETGRSLPSHPEWECLRAVLPINPGFVDVYEAAEREVTGTDTKARSTSGASALPTGNGRTEYKTWDITAPATEAAQQWDGWGTALKPALEPITLARKPLAGTVAQTVLAHGTGALNIDASRIQHDEPIKPMDAQSTGDKVYRQAGRRTATTELKPAGRWPANLLHDGSDEVTALFPDTGPTVARNGSRTGKDVGRYGAFAGQSEAVMGHDDAGGSAARFFYVPKASTADRGEDNDHPTVKPVALMHYLCRLVTPPRGVILDPYAGSGTTLVAGRDLGFQVIGIDHTEASCAIVVGRLAQGVLDL